MLAVIGAMEEEIALLRTDMVVTNEAVHAGITVYQGTFKGVALVLAQCGVGKVNAAICTQMIADLYAPDALVFSGVAGGLLPNMKVGDLVVASHLIQYDVDVTAFGHRHGELPGQTRAIEADPALVQACAAAFDAAFDGIRGAPNLMLGTVVSGDTFVSNPETLRWLQREFSALATEMEGAAVGYTCKQNAVPFVIVRGLSDTAGDSAHNDFGANLHLVCEHVHRLLEKLIPQLS